MRILSAGMLAACAVVLSAADPVTSPATDWATHKDSGFSVETPPGWTAGSDPRKGWVHLMGTQGEDVVIWPVFLPGAPAALDLRTAQFIHQKLAAACPYNAEWEVAKAMGSNIVRARGRSGEMIAVSAFTWKISPRGVAGYFYVAGARETDFNRKAADLVKILQSFRLIGTPGGGTGSGIQWVQFADPLEGAFTAEVPAGWKAGGGMVRSGPHDPHIVVSIASPDGQTRIALGDAQMSTFFMEPGGGYIPEGQMNGSIMILRYLTGAYFCRFYVSSRVPMFCGDLQITDMRDNPELIQYALSRDPSLAQRQFSIGSVSFQCREQGQLKAGYCQALTARLAYPMGGQIGTWTLQGPLGFLTPSDRVEQTRAMMIRMAESVKVSPQWGMQEVHNAGIRSGIISGTANQIADMMASSQRYKDAVDDRIAQMKSDATLGIVRVADPATGRQTTVDSGSNYYWVDPRGVIVGTNVDALPGVDFRRLVELPSP